MDLLNLPSELVSQIAATLMNDCKVRGVVRFRLVCKRFNEEILRALWTTRALERPRLAPWPLDHPTYGRGPELYAEYLLQRSMNDKLRHHHYTIAFRDALALIVSIDASSIPDETRALRIACLSTFRNISEEDALEQLEEDPKHCSIPENALALAARLGLESVFQKLIERGTPEAETYFGTPLSCVSETNDKFLIQAYLNVRSAAQQALTFSETSRKRSTRRGISMRVYRITMKLAMIYCTPEILYMIADAAIEDRQLSCLWSDEDEFYQHDREDDDDYDYDNHDHNGAEKALHNAVLLSAAEHGRLDMAQAALDRGAYVDTQAPVYESDGTPLDVATRNGHLEMVKYLVAKGASLGNSEPHRRSVLGTAARFGHVNIARFYIDAGVTDFLDEHAWSHLIYLAANSKSSTASELTQMLLDERIAFKDGSPTDQVLESHGNPKVQAALTRYRERAKQEALMTCHGSEE